jgi:putative SOS response-associated peptidase YedK
MCYNVSIVEKTATLVQERLLFTPAMSKCDWKIEPRVFDELPLYNAVRLMKLPIITLKENELRVFKAQWWLIPHWSKTGKPETTAFNARLETIAGSRLFSPYFKFRRCIFPVDGFYEYSSQELVTLNDKKKKVKQPYFFARNDKEPLLLAGVYSVWKNEQAGETLSSFATLTKEPDKIVGEIHDRMPVLLDQAGVEIWLDEHVNDPGVLETIARKSTEMISLQRHPVDAGYLYDRSHQDAKCREEITIAKRSSDKE